MTDLIRQQHFLVFLFIYLLLLNLLGFALFGLDKHRAVQKSWRLPEGLFFLIAAAGAVPGLWFGMKAFRHKTRHWQFRLGLPLIGLFQILLLVWVYNR